MDRQAWIAISLCVLAFFGYEVYVTRYAPRTPVPVTVASPTPGIAATPSAAPSPTGSPAALAGSPAASPAPSASPVEAFAEKTEPLRNDDVELRLTNKGGGIRDARLLHHAAEHGQGEIVLDVAEQLPIGAIIEDPNAPALREFTLARQPDGSVQLERRTAEGITIRQRFSFPPPQGTKDNYAVDMRVEFRNDGAAAYQNPGYFVALGSTQPLHPRDLPTYTRLVWCINGSAKSTDVNWFGAQKYPVVGVEKRAAQSVFQQKVDGAEWGAMSNQFFATIVTALTSKADQMWARRFDLPQPDAAPPLYGLEGAMGMPAFELQPGQSNTQSFQIYAGPKLYHRLSKFGHDESEIMNFGIFKLVSQALLNFLNLIHGLVRNYGVAIILLTACVKGVLWPLQNKANKSMRRMSALAPRMQELKDKYKDDPTKMNTEVMKLYKEHGVNPVGGCLPMMIQIPIFFGLFSMLGQAAELRNAHFLWVHDLSQPDTLFVIPGLGWIPFLGNAARGLPVNILPLFMGATNIWLMRMTPNTGDAMQRRMMMFMPLIFLVFCYNFAAALALYYTTQNLFTILQLWQNKRQPVPVLAPATPVGKRGKKGKS